MSVLGIDLVGPIVGPAGEILTDEALGLVARFQREFGSDRERLLSDRAERQRSIDGGELPDYRAGTVEIRRRPWQVPPPPPDFSDRRVEITGPVDRKMMINALNSGARVFMADFEDATTPTWSNLIEGQANLVDAYRRTLALDTPEKKYRLADQVATLVVRPRGWHLPEKHLLIDSRPVSGSLFDFGLYMFHGARAALEAGTAPYLYVPKLESHLEARLWNEIFRFAQDALSIPRGTIRATVLIETVLAAFEMDEILYELGEHAAGLNAGRWDYIFSIIKKFRNWREFLLPDRAQVTMTVPFMRAYTKLLVATCHRRGAHAIGGMAAFIPNRRKPEVTQRALARVSEDKRREAGEGFDGTWVAHPDLVKVAEAEFDPVLGKRPNQIGRLGEEVEVHASDLLNVGVEGGSVTQDGVAANIDVAIRYLSSWLSGTGAAAINDLMEDVATAEIARSQIWQWLRHGARMPDGRMVTRELVTKIADEVEAALGLGASPVRRVFDQVALAEEFTEFLTLPAYQLID